MKNRAHKIKRKAGLQKRNNVQVMVRVRPINDIDREKENGDQSCITVEGKNIIFEIPRELKRTYSFDQVAPEDTDQLAIFEMIGIPITDKFIEGYNGTIFAYGQTGAGKTHTIQGKQQNEPQMREPNHPLSGLVPRVINQTFQKLKKAKEENIELEVAVKVNYLEVYNENIRDLFTKKDDVVSLSIRENLGGPYVHGLKEKLVENEEQAMVLYNKGTLERHTGATKMNANSSRSHSVFTLNIVSKLQKRGIWNVTRSKLNIVDLAGSERQKKSGAKGERSKEANNINKSLSTLGLVIDALADKANGIARFVHYRNSKITFLLKDSIGGNSQTYLIANISPSAASIEETKSTLEFAVRAKKIQNKAMINEDSPSSLNLLKADIKRMKIENDKLAKELKLQEAQTTMLLEINPGITPLSDVQLQEIFESIHGEKVMALAASEPEEEKEGKTNKAKEAYLIPFPKKQEENANQDEEIKSEEPEESQKLISSSVKKSIPPSLHNFTFYEHRIKQLQILIHNDREIKISLENYFEKALGNQAFDIQSLQDNFETLHRLLAINQLGLKLKEDRIQRMKKDSGYSPNERDKEINELKKQLEQKQKIYESNPQIIQLTNKITLLKRKVQKLKLEKVKSPKSMGRLLQDKILYLRQVEEFNKELFEENELLRNCSEIQRENSKLNEQVQELMEKNQKSQEEIEKLQQIIESYESQLVRKKYSEGTMADVKLDYAELLEKESSKLEREREKVKKLKEEKQILLDEGGKLESDYQERFKRQIFDLKELEKDYLNLCDTNERQLDSKKNEIISLKQDQETQALFITQNEERMKILEEDLRKAKEKNLPEEIKEEVEFLKSKLKELDVMLTERNKELEKEKQKNGVLKNQIMRMPKKEQTYEGKNKKKKENEINNNKINILTENNKSLYQEITELKDSLRQYQKAPQLIQTPNQIEINHMTRKMFKMVADFSAHVDHTEEIRILNDNQGYSHVIDDITRKWDFLVESHRTLVTQVELLSKKK